MGQSLCRPGDYLKRQRFASMAGVAYQLQPGVPDDQPGVKEQLFIMLSSAYVSTQAGREIAFEARDARLEIHTNGEG